jgi:hypothetical protein
VLKNEAEHFTGCAMDGSVAILSCLETGMWEITSGKSASVHECVRSCRYTASLECQLMEPRFRVS